MAAISPGEYVDTWVNLPSPTLRENMDPNIMRWFAKSSPDVLGGVTPEQMFQKMDAGGVQIGLLTNGIGGVPVNPFIGGYDGFTLDKFRGICAEVAAICDQFPGRLYGAALIDPTQGMNAVRMVEIAVKEYKFKAVRLFGALTNIPPNHPICYPIYTKAIELDIPVTVNVGVPGPLRFARSQRPMDLDDVLVSLPEVKIVMTHIGHPWYEETVALLQKHANAYLMTSGWAPKHVPAPILHLMNTRGQHKVMWSADYPIQTFERCVREANELPLREGVLRKYMRDNAMQVFKLG